MFAGIFKHAGQPDDRVNERGRKSNTLRTEGRAGPALVAINAARSEPDTREGEFDLPPFPAGQNRWKMVNRKLRLSRQNRVDA